MRALHLLANGKWYFVRRLQSCCFPMHALTSQIMWQWSRPGLISTPKWAEKDSKSSRGEFKGNLSFFLIKGPLSERPNNQCSLEWGGTSPSHMLKFGNIIPSRELLRRLHLERQGSSWKELRVFSHVLGSVFWERGQLSASGNMGKGKRMTRNVFSNLSPIWGTWPSAYHS